MNRLRLPAIAALTRPIPLPWAKPKGAARTLPIGLDIGADGVRAVACIETDDHVVVEAAAARGYGGSDPGAVAAALREAIAELDVREKRCVLGLSVPDAFAMRVSFAPGMNRAAIISASKLEARRYESEIPARERSISLAPSGDGIYVVGVARRSAVNRRAAIARAAGLRVVAVDHEACAWRRAVVDSDAVLDFAEKQATLTLFGDPIGESRVLSYADFPEDHDLVEAIRAILNVARLEDVADVRRLAVAGRVRGRAAFLETLAIECGIVVNVAEVAGEEGAEEPRPWLLAYGLALWSVPARVMPAEDEAVAS